MGKTRLEMQEPGNRQPLWDLKQKVDMLGFMFWFKKKKKKSTTALRIKKEGQRKLEQSIKGLTR